MWNQAFIRRHDFDPVILLDQAFRRRRDWDVAPRNIHGMAQTTIWHRSRDIAGSFLADEIVARRARGTNSVILRGKACGDVTFGARTDNYFSASWKVHTHPNSVVLLLS